MAPTVRQNARTASKRPLFALSDVAELCPIVLAGGINRSFVDRWVPGAIRRIRAPRPLNDFLSLPPHPKTSACVVAIAAMRG
jgi:hypothetical protein